MKARRRRRVALGKGKTTLFLAAAAAAPVLSRGGIDTWSDGTGNWSGAPNWSLGHVPAAGDTVNLTQSDGITRVVSYDAAATSGAGFAQLPVDATGSGNMTLSLALSTLTASNEYVGFNGRGTYNQSGGTNNVTGGSPAGLYFGYNNGASGTGTLSGGTLSV